MTYDPRTQTVERHGVIENPDGRDVPCYVISSSVHPNSGMSYWCVIRSKGAYEVDPDGCYEQRPKHPLYVTEVLAEYVRLFPN